ncbi:hypothetical protein EV715DRAFT_268308 [Schizophyllum commune]
MPGATILVLPVKLPDAEVEASGRCVFCKACATRHWKQRAYVKVPRQLRFFCGEQQPRAEAATAMITRNRIARDSSVQGVGQGLNHAGFERGSQGGHAAYTRGGCKIHAVEKPENALDYPLVSETTRRTSPHVQSPIGRLPNELLCAIFLLTGDPSPASVFPRDRIMHPYELDRRTVQLYSKCAVLLGRVCARWRAVACSYPKLWTIVDVVYPGREATRRLQRCLRYSAGLPLTLWISRSLKFDANKSVDSRFMSLVACNAHRWVEISIELWRELEVLQPLVALPPGSFQALRRARIYLYGAGTEASTADSLLWRSLCTSPSLEVVDWMREQYIQTGLSKAPLHQLTRLAVHWINPSVLIPVLSTCTRLELLLISINSTLLGQEHQGPLPIHSPICLPHLRILMLCGPADWERLFSSLIAPTLDRLEISRMSIQRYAIERMLRNSKAHLKMLTIHWPAKDQTDDILALLQTSYMQYLQILRYERYYKDGWNLGWEDKFDLRPFVPDRIAFTESAAQAERYYAQMVPDARTRWNASTGQDKVGGMSYEEQRREALKRVLTQSEYPLRAVVSKSAEVHLRCESNPVTRRKAHNSQLPINRLPNELLCAIFLLTGDPSPVSGFPRDHDMHDNGLHPFAVRLYSKAAVLLGRVCFRWMHVTRGFPALWTVVDVTFPGARATAILKRCLEYSAGLPLVLWICKSVDPNESHYGVDPRFMRLVAANAHRWVEISIQLGDECHALQPLISLPSGSFIALRRARIEFRRIHVTGDSLDTLLWRSFYTSPHLVALDWNRTQYTQYSLSSAPLQQLTKLGIYCSEPAMLLPIFINCTALEVLVLHINWPWGPEEEDEAIPLPSLVCLPRLRALALHGSYDWRPLFSALEVPSLNRLDLSHMDIEHVDIESMLRRSSARLMMLTIHWPGMDQGGNIVALLHSTAMRSLQIGDPSTDGKIHSTYVH